jgi:hypothetical protein
MIRAEVPPSANRELVEAENKPAPSGILPDTSNPLIPSGLFISFESQSMKHTLPRLCLTSMPD